MQIVIEISEYYYEILKHDVEHGNDYVPIKLIANGIPLPKGHGRLIDADRLRSMYSINQANFNTVVGIQKWIDHAETIIEADKERDNV